MIYVVGNVIAFIAALIMVYSGLMKNKKKIIYAQSVQLGLISISDLIMGGVTGAIVNLVSCVRNILCYKNKLNITAKILITLITTILSIKFNNLGFIGLLPLISTIVYIWTMDTRNVIKLKIVIILTMITWFIYEMTIKLYISAIFDIANIIANIITIKKIKSKTE